MLLLKKYLFTFSSVIILLVALLQVKSLFNSYWFVSHDGIFHLVRSEEMSLMIGEGQFPVRWGLTLDNRYGIPLFNFIYISPYYLSSLLHWLGIDFTLSLKLIVYLAYSFGAIGYYFIFKKRNKLSALFAAILYLFTPYLFLNIFVRFALGEIVAMGLLPWVYLSFINLSDKKNKLKWFHPLPLFFLLVSHNFISVIFFLFIVLYFLLIKKMTINIFFSIILSFGLAAFFVLPLFFEKDYLLMFKFQLQSYNYSEHLVPLVKLIYSRWTFGYSNPNSPQSMSFQLGLANILIFLIFLFFKLTKKGFAKKSDLLFLFYFPIIFIMTPQAQFIWRIIGPLQQIQFPWRLLFLTTFLTPFLSFEIFNFLARKDKRLLYFFALLILVLAFYNTRNYKNPMKFMDEEETRIETSSQRNKTTTTSRNEVVPFWSKNEHFNQTATIKNGDLKILTYNNGDSLVSLDIDSVTSGLVILPKNYFPSWKLKIDSLLTKNNLQPSEDGSILLSVIPGRHRYEIFLGKTVVEGWSEVISGFSLVFWFTCFIFPKTKIRLKKV